jgi:glycogen operon protein
MPDLYVMFNAHWEWREFSVPPHDGQWNWKRLVDTSLPSPDDIVQTSDAVRLDPPDHYNLGPRSAAILLSECCE